jgi:hypothetical protein
MTVVCLAVDAGVAGVAGVTGVGVTAGVTVISLADSPVFSEMGETGARESINGATSDI